MPCRRRRGVPILRPISRPFSNSKGPSQPRSASNGAKQSLREHGFSLHSLSKLIMGVQPTLPSFRPSGMTILLRHFENVTAIAMPNSAPLPRQSKATRLIAVCRYSVGHLRNGLNAGPINQNERYVSIRYQSCDRRYPRDRYSTVLPVFRARCEWNSLCKRSTARRRCLVSTPASPRGEPVPLPCLKGAP